MSGVTAESPAGGRHQQTATTPGANPLDDGIDDTFVSEHARLGARARRPVPPGPYPGASPRAVRALSACNPVSRAFGRVPTIAHRYLRTMDVGRDDAHRPYSGE